MPYAPAVVIATPPGSYPGAAQVDYTGPNTAGFLARKITVVVDGATTAVAISFDGVADHIIVDGGSATGATFDVGRVTKLWVRAQLGAPTKCAIVAQN